MSIKSREDANKYYQIVNELVDEYMAKGKIRPSNLKVILATGSKNFNNFIQTQIIKTFGVTRESFQKRSVFFYGPFFIKFFFNISF